MSRIYSGASKLKKGFSEGKMTVFSVGGLKEIEALPHRRTKVG